MGGWDSVVVQLVAHHTGAAIEAEERGLGAELAAYMRPPDNLLDALTTSDMTTGPTGDHVSARDRIAKIARRYGRDDPVYRTVSRSGPGLLATVERVEAELRVRKAQLPDKGDGSGGV
jgi:hypothetical protein